MANWQKTKTPGVYVAHQRRCPAFENDDARCRCEPSWRGRRHNRVLGKAEWQKPVTKDRSEVLSWLGIGKRGASHVRDSCAAANMPGFGGADVGTGAGRCRPRPPACQDLV